MSSSRQIRFEGRSAVVTGAASGIGRAVAELLRDEGAAVLAVDRNAELLADARGLRAARLRPLDPGWRRMPWLRRPKLLTCS